MNAPVDAAAATEAEIRVNLAACYRLVALLWLGRSRVHPYFGPHPRARASFPHQPLWHDVRGDHRLEPGQDRSQGREGRRPRPTPSIPPASPSIRRCMRCARTPAASCICTRPTARRSRPRRRACCRSTRRRSSCCPISPITTTRASRSTSTSGRGCSATSAPKNIMLLHNHGTLTVGRTCAEAFLRMYFLERACTMQVRTRDARRRRGGLSDRARRDREERGAGALAAACRWSREQLVWPALLRKLDRLDPGFRD